MSRDFELWRRMKRLELGPAWRWRSARSYVDSGQVRMSVEFDVATRNAGDFLRRKSHSEADSVKADKKYPLLAAAEAAWRRPDLRAPIQMLVLAGLAASEICECLKLEAEVLEVIESLHFDVRPLLSSPQWIVAHVIVPEAEAGRDDLAARLRVAYFGGPSAAKTLVEAKFRLPTEPARQLADASMLLYAKFVQAIEMPLTPEQSVEFLRLTTENYREEQRLRLERDKLAFRMRRWTQRLELAQSRRTDPHETSPSVVEAGEEIAPDRPTPAEMT